MKLSKRKRMRVLTAAAELVSLCHRLQGRFILEAGDPGDDPKTDLAVWRACQPLGDVFEFDWSPLFDTPEPEPGADRPAGLSIDVDSFSSDDSSKVIEWLESVELAMPADSYFSDESSKVIKWLDSVVIREEEAATANLPQIGRLIDCLQTHNKFIGGLWDGFVSSGHLAQAIQRLEALLQSQPDLDADPAPPPRPPGERPQPR